MIFKTEDEAIDYYQETLQDDFPYDITESNIDLMDGFDDFMEHHIISDKLNRATIRKHYVATNWCKLRWDLDEWRRDIVLKQDREIFGV